MDDLSEATTGRTDGTDPDAVEVTFSYNEIAIAEYLNKIQPTAKMFEMTAGNKWLPLVQIVYKNFVETIESLLFTAFLAGSNEQYCGGAADDAALLSGTIECDMETFLI